MKIKRIFSFNFELSLKKKKKNLFCRNPEVFGALLDVLSTDKLSLSSSISEAILQDEFNYWNLGAIEDLDLIEGDDDDDDDDEGIGSGGGGSGDHTDSESPQRSHHVSIPSNVRIPIISNSSNSSNCSSRDRLDTRYSMHADEMFGRAIALVRQEDLIVKVGDIQHGLALLRELLSMERSNVSYMFYLAYGEMRLGRTTEACYWCDRVLKLDPTNLAAASLRTLINDRRKQNSVTGLIVVGGIAVAAAVAWFVSRAASAPASNN